MTSRQVSYDMLAGNARRHNAKRRMVPIGRCGCIRVPDHDRHRCGDEISDVMAHAAAAALAHLDRVGAPGLLDIDTCRAMWRRGHRRLAVECADRAGWAA